MDSLPLALCGQSNVIIVFIIIKDTTGSDELVHVC